MISWTYEGEFPDRAGKRWHVWSRLHREGFTAYHITCLAPPAQPKVSSGHYDSCEALARKTGITVPKIS